MIFLSQIIKHFQMLQMSDFILKFHTKYFIIKRKKYNCMKTIINAAVKEQKLQGKIT